MAASLKHSLGALLLTQATDTMRVRVLESRGGAGLGIQNQALGPPLEGAGRRAGHPLAGGTVKRAGPSRIPTANQAKVGLNACWTVQRGKQEAENDMHVCPVE